MFRWLLNIVSDDGKPDATNSELLETIIPIVIFVLIFTAFIFIIRTVKKHFSKNDNNDKSE